MLREDVVEAVQQGKFAVYAVETIDDAIELLTAEKAETVNRRIENKLLEYARQRRNFAEKAEHAE